MIIECPKCQKKFELNESLIPETGRLLQCGKCGNKWHYIKPEIANLSQKKKIQKKKIENRPKIKIPKSQDKVSQKEIKIDLEKSNVPVVFEKKKSFKFFNILIVSIISLVAMILIIDTFKGFIITYVPDIEIYLNNLYETIKDIYLFFEDLTQ